MQGDETAAAEELAEGETMAAKGLPDGETTTLGEGKTMAAEAVAWSLDETPTVRHGRPVSGVLVVLVVSTAGIVALLALLLAAVLRPTKAPQPPAVVTTTPSATAAPAPAPPAPPPATVTVAPPTVTVHTAPPPEPPAPAPPGRGRFIVCPSGRDGVASAVTSCAFADNVRRVYYNQGQPDSLVAYSPVTDESYLMQCFGPYRATFTDGDVQDVVKCVGGNDAEVVVW